MFSFFVCVCEKEMTFNHHRYCNVIGLTERFQHHRLINIKSCDPDCDDILTFPTSLTKSDTDSRDNYELKYTHKLTKTRKCSSL